MPRTWLLARMEAAGECPLTLVAAPEGFGKTTLIAGWARTRSAPIAWCSLEPDDNDLARFLAGVILAVRSVRPGFGEDLLADLLDVDEAGAEGVLDSIAGELAACPPGAGLVLDGYGEIHAPAVLRAVRLLAERVGAPARLVLATRKDPGPALRRLRAGVGVFELRAADLQVGVDEAAFFLRGLAGPQLSEAQVKVLVERTGGCMAGLRLAASVLAQSPSPETVLSGLQGGPRHVAAALVDRALDAAPEPVREFLLRTSFLERLSGGLCDAVTGGSDGAALLNDLGRTGLFLSPLDEGREWYGSDSLVARALRSRWEKRGGGETPELHRRAAAWLAGQGLVEESVRHSLLAGEPESAARLVGPVAFSFVGQGRFALARRWLEVLPREVLARDPALRRWYAWMLLPAGLGEDWQRFTLPAAESDASGSRDRDLQAAAACLRGETDRCIALARRALEEEPAPRGIRRGLARLVLAMGLAQNGRPEEAEPLLAQAHAGMRESRAGGLAYFAMAELAHVRLQRGQLHSAAEVLRAADLLASRHLHCTLTGTCHFSGTLHLERNDLDAAETCRLEVLDLARRLGSYVWIPAAYLLGVRLRLARNRPRAAAGELASGVEAARRLGLAGHLPEIESLRARVWLAQGDLASVERWAQEQSLTEEDTIPYPRQPLYLELARLRIARCRERLDSAALERSQRLLDRLHSAAEAAGRTRDAIEIRILEALAWRARGATARAVIAMEEALSLAAPEEYVRVFLDEGPPVARLLALVRPHDPVGTYVERLLQAFGGRSHPGSAAEGGPCQPLSPRETEVLRLLGAGLSNQDIADALFLSLNTVKTHLRQLYVKLAAQNRTEAVALGRAFGLI